MREPITPTAPKRSQRPSAAAATSAPKADDSAFISTLSLWQTSRKGLRANTPDASAGTRRPFTFENVLLAWQILTLSLHGVPHLVFPRLGDRARDIFILIVVYVVRGLLPASRAFSHARILDELQKLIFSADSSGSWHTLGWLFLVEILRTLFEQAIDVITAAKESQIRRRVRLQMEEIQMRTRLRLDIVSLSDPQIRDLLHESDLFINSFSSSFGPLSPLDLLSAFTTLADAGAQCFILWNLTDASSWTLQPVFLLVALMPTLLNLSSFFVGPSRSPWAPADGAIPTHSEKAERMRTLAFSDHYRQEVIFFNLASWIMKEWRHARSQLLRAESESAESSRSTFMQSVLHNGTSEVIHLIQNVALAPQMAGVSLGTITMWRSTISVLLHSITNASRSFDSAFQSIFLAAAFSAALDVRPKLDPPPQHLTSYQTAVTEDGNRGMAIEAKSLSFTYEGASTPSLKEVNIRIEPGESVAIVGYNGSGKTTFASLILRLLDFQQGELLINGVDIRNYNPRDLHSHTTALFQQFARFSNSTLRENTGFGRIDSLESTHEIATALDRAGAGPIVAGCPDGIDTKLDFSAFDSPPSSGGLSPGFNGRRSLSGGEWQRVAIARCLMRAEHCDLLLLDEASSALDARAQRELFERIEEIARTPDGHRKMTVIYITHRLSTVRHADKVAMFENGQLADFGTHNELLSRSSSTYKKLFDAFAT